MDTWRLLPHQETQPWKHKLARCVVDDVYLAGIEARFEVRQRYIQFDCCCLPIRRIDLIYLDERGFKNLAVVPEESGIGQQTSGRLVPYVDVVRMLRIVDLKEKIKVLVL